MLESIGFSFKNAQLVSLEKNLIDEYIKNNPSEVVMVMGSSMSQINQPFF